MLKRRGICQTERGHEVIVAVFDFSAFDTGVEQKQKQKRSDVRTACNREQTQRKA